MANCDFYAVGDDFALVLDFVFDQPGWVLVELASHPDMPLMRFTSRSEIERAFDLDVDDVLLQLHSPAMGAPIVEHQITFRPGAVPGARGRTDSEGWGLIQLYLMAPRNGRIRPSHTNCNSETRARNWEPTLDGRLGRVDAWNWREVERMSARLNRFIRSRAVAKSGSRAILPAAAAAVAAGVSLART